jgi:hypothetical protein
MAHPIGGQALLVLIELMAVCHLFPAFVEEFDPYSQVGPADDYARDPFLL